MANIINRVFDSSGPEGKVRGTPQQIIDKYLAHARDAQLANDRVAAENFLQHAEHYARLLGEAQREAEARREQQQLEQQNRNREEHAARRDAPAENHAGKPPRTDQAEAADGKNHGPRSEIGDTRSAGNGREPRPRPKQAPDVIDLSDGAGSTLVDTPENATIRPPSRPAAAKPPKLRAKHDDDASKTAPEAQQKPAAQ